MPLKKFNPGQNTDIADIKLVNIINVIVGDNVKIGCFVTIKEGVIIGNNVEVEDSVYISSNTIIKDNVKIGAGCRILNGIKIGERSIIRPGSTITKDVDSHMIVTTKGNLYEKKLSRRKG